MPRQTKPAEQSGGLFRFRLTNARPNIDLTGDSYGGDLTRAASGPSLRARISALQRSRASLVERERHLAAKPSNLVSPMQAS
jgi:hypothetical protein